jgi:serine/threonine protein kinase
LELGKKISEGAQAEVYEARMTRDGPFTLVAKVMMGDAPLQAFQAQWPIGMLSAYNSSYVFDLPLMTILGGTVLATSRLWGRFAFVMYRRWGDLRLLIDRRMKLKRTTVGPFFIEQVIQLMMRIAEDMDGLHTNHGIIHRDLKASNVLVWGDFDDNVNVIAPSEDEKIESVVADFECSLGVLGTRWWRALEILRQTRARVPGTKVQFTRACDVYSYGMTCYEIVTGRLPFED